MWLLGSLDEKESDGCQTWWLNVSLIQKAMKLEVCRRLENDIGNH